MSKALTFAAVAEATTGAALIVFPSLVGKLLLGEEFVGVTLVVGHVLGVSLVALRIACWPGPARAGILVYRGAITVYLAYAGLALHLGGSCFGRLLSCMPS